MRSQEVSAIHIHPLSIARAIWKRKISAALIALGLSGATIVVVRRLPAIYKSDAVVLVDSQKIPDRYVSSSVNSDVGDRLATISQQILSSSKLKKIIQDFDLYSEDRKRRTEEEVIEQIRKDIEVKVEKGWSGNRPGAFRVGYRGHVPETVAGVANRIANLFVDENLHARELQAEGTSEFIVTELDGAKKKLDELEAAVSKYKVAHNGELPQQENVLIGTLARLQLESQANQETMNRAQQNKVMLENALSFHEAAEAVSAANASVGSAESTPGRKAESTTEGGIANPYERAAAEIEGRLLFLRTRYTDDHPEMKVLLLELARVRGLEAQQKQKNPSIAGGTQDKADVSVRPPSEVAKSVAKQPVISGQIAGIKAQLKLTNDELLSRAAQQERIHAEIAGIQARVERLPVREQEMAGVMRDYEISKANYKSLLDKKLSADMAAEMERRQKSERFTVIDPARVPEKPVSPNRPLFIGLGCFVSLLVGLGFALGQDLRTGVLLGEWELPPDTIVLGRIPNIQPGRKSSADLSSDNGFPPQVTWRKTALLLKTRMLKAGRISSNV